MSSRNHLSQGTVSWEGCDKTLARERAALIIWSPCFVIQSIKTTTPHRPGQASQAWPAGLYTNDTSFKNLLDRYAQSTQSLGSAKNTPKRSRSQSGSQVRSTGVDRRPGLAASRLKGHVIYVIKGGVLFTKIKIAILIPLSDFIVSRHVHSDVG